MNPKLEQLLINFPLRKAFVSLFEAACRRRRIIDRSAVFVSHPDFCDNSYPLYAELKARGYRCLWVTYYDTSKPIAKQNGMTCIRWKKSLRNMWTLSQYHYVFYSHEKPYVYDKVGQEYYNCWHGSPFKVYHGVLLDNKKEGCFFVPPGVGSLQLYLEHYSDQLCEARCLPYRHFRTDYYMSDFQPEERAKVEAYFNTSKYKKVALVCLTWIRDKEVNQTTNNLLGFPLGSADFDALNRHLAAEETLLIIKPHPGQKVERSFSYSNIRVVSSFELTQNLLQLYALIGMCDMLITDYSSILFDYSLLDKPVGHIIHHWDYFLNNDHEAFIYDDPDDVMYGTKIHSLDELCSFLSQPPQNDEVKRQQINRRYNADPDLQQIASRRFIQEVLEA